MKSKRRKTLTRTLKASRQRLAGVDVLADLPDPPDELTGSAVSSWWQCGKLAIDAGTLTRFDLPLLELTARTLGSVADLEELLRKDGLIVISGEVRKAHPGLQALDRARALAHRLLGDLGLTPTAREKLSIEKPRQGNPFDRL